MKNIALCVYTDSVDYQLDEELKKLGYHIFFEYRANLYMALRNVSVKKRIHEMKTLTEFDICIGFDPVRANFNDLILKDPVDNMMYHAYGYFDPKKFLVGAEPSLFYSKTVEFNRICEFIDNYENITDFRLDRIGEKFIFHIRSLYIKNECFNYENSSLFIRPA